MKPMAHFPAWRFINFHSPFALVVSSIFAPSWENTKITLAPSMGIPSSEVTLPLARAQAWAKTGEAQSMIKKPTLNSAIMKFFFIYSNLLLFIICYHGKIIAITQWNVNRFFYDGSIYGEMGGGEGWYCMDAWMYVDHAIMQSCSHAVQPIPHLPISPIPQPPISIQFRNNMTKSYFFNIKVDKNCLFILLYICSLLCDIKYKVYYGGHEWKK